MLQSVQKAALLLLFAHAAAVLAATANPASVPLHAVAIGIQAANVGSLALAAGITVALARAPVPWTIRIPLAAFSASLAVRLGFLLLKDDSYQLSAKMVRWDAPVATAGAVAAAAVALGMAAQHGARSWSWLLLLAAAPVLSAVPAVLQRRAGGIDPVLVDGALRYSQMAYSSKYQKPGGEVTFVHDQATDTRAVVVRVPGSDEVYAAFAGTDSRENMATSVRLSDKPVPWCTEGGAGRVHAGYLKGYEAVREAVWGGIMRRLHGVRVVVLCGHSLGGALATIAAVDIGCRLPVDDKSKVRLYTFGAPGVGDGQFVNAFDAAVPHAVRAVTLYDPVPKLLAPQFLHVKGYQPVNAAEFDNPATAHLLHAYRVGLTRGGGLRAAVPCAVLALAALPLILSLLRARRAKT